MDPVKLVRRLVSTRNTTKKAYDAADAKLQGICRELGVTLPEAALLTTPDTTTPPKRKYTRKSDTKAQVDIFLASHVGHTVTPKLLMETIPGMNLNQATISLGQRARHGKLEKNGDGFMVPQPPKAVGADVVTQH